MLSLLLQKHSNDPLNILCLGAHCDDIEIGCGGTLLNLLERNSAVNVYWQVFSSTPARKPEAVAGAERFTENANDVEISILDFRDGYLPYEGAKVKDAIEQTKSTFMPDIVFTHYRRDLHQDHRKISELTWNTFRNHLILEYEIPKFDGDFGSPNCFVPMQMSHVDRKSDILIECYESQRDRQWFSRSTFEALMRLRGIECNSESGFAEAFYARKIIVD